MELLVNQNTQGIKGTAKLNFPIIITDNNPVQRLERRIFSFINNPDWIYETLIFINKVEKFNNDFNNFDHWVLNRLDLELNIENNSLNIKDRYHSEITLEMLSELKNIILNLTCVHASNFLKDTKNHPMEKSFKKVIRKAGKRILTEEENSILKDSYLKVENGNVVNLKGNKVKLPKFSFLTLIK